MSPRPQAGGTLLRLVQSTDFERVLGIRRRAATTHFAVHHLPGEPEPRHGDHATGVVPGKLSTFLEPAVELPVDDSPARGRVTGTAWIGVVVPKRHARRAVTRSLLKRQIYSAVERHHDRLGPGLWIVRLRSPFDRARFPSAASAALRHDARAELESLLEIAAGPTTPTARR